MAALDQDSLASLRLGFRLYLLGLLLLLLLLQLLLLLLGQVMADRAPGRGSQHSVMTGNMSCNGTDCRPFDAPFGRDGLGAGEKCDSKHGDRKCLHLV